MNFAKLTFNSLRITSKGHIYIYNAYVSRTIEMYVWELFHILPF